MRAILAACCLAFSLAAQAQEAPIAWRSGAEAEAIERRIDALIARMTLAEKVGQLNLIGRGESFDEAKIGNGEAGAIMNFIHPSEIRPLQDLASRSRLGIPLIIGLDAIHGFATYFPMPLGQAASFNPSLMELAAYWTAREARAAGINWTFAPMVDLTRDPRWGRVIEGAGESVHLGRVAARARTEGYHRGGVATSAKHFAGYGAVEGGRDYNSVFLPRSALLDHHVPPFQASLEAGAMTVMTSLSAMNGVPSTADRPLITDLLKGRLRFRGFVVSDFDSVRELIQHGVARDGAEAARRAFLAGVDMDMFAQLYDRYLAGEVAAGRVTMAAVDDAVRRVLRVKMHMGLFEGRPVEPALTAARLTMQEAQAAALAVAREAMVLLKNQAEILPLTPATRTIAVIGPLASADDDWQYASHVELPRIRRTTLGVELRRHLPGTTVLEEAGLSSTCGTAFADRLQALDAARAADVIVAVLGEDCAFHGESASRTRLDLPGVQEELLDDLIATGKPVVLIVEAGRPLVLTHLVGRVAAILHTFHTGSLGRVAMGEILAGRVNPSAKLPMSMPRSVGQIPVYHDMLPTGRPRLTGERYQSGYVDEENTPLFPFGFGLSFTRFALARIEIETPVVGPGETVAVSVDVANLGSRAGSEVVQLYVRPHGGSRSRPARSLMAFAKVEVPAGETRRVQLQVAVADLGFHDDDGRFHLEPGRYTAHVGTDATAEAGVDFELTGGR